MIYRTLAAVGALGIVLGAAAAQPMDHHQIVAPDAIKWGPAAPTLPAGAQAAILYGDPAKDGLFAMRLKFPKGYVIGPHTHPRPEVVTVIAGTFRLGMGDKADPAKLQALTAGSFFAVPPGMAHFAAADEDTIIQLTSNGPWAITYVNPADDPRK